MEKQIVIFFDGYFKKLDASVLLENEFDVDFDGQMMVRFLNASDGSVTAINGMNGYGANIANEIIVIIVYFAIPVSIDINISASE